VHPVPTIPVMPLKRPESTPREEMIAGSVANPTLLQHCAVPVLHWPPVWGLGEGEAAARALKKATAMAVVNMLKVALDDRSYVARRMLLN
jgi:hypothetical protein